jgi:hypothetical protein
MPELTPEQEAEALRAVRRAVYDRRADVLVRTPSGETARASNLPELESLLRAGCKIETSCPPPAASADGGRHQRRRGQ